MPTLTTRSGRRRGRRRPVLLALALVLAVVAAVPPALADTATPDPGSVTSRSNLTSSPTKDPIASAHDRLQPRIYNGVPASIADLPSVVFIANQTNGGACTGTIIAPRWVLTAAHCFNQPFTQTTPDPPEILVLAGRDTWSNQPADWPEVHVAESGIHHPSWNPTSDVAAHDLALLRLATPTSFPPMALTPAGPPDHFGQQATVTGWGITQDDPAIDTDLLRRATVDVRPHTDCEAQWGWQYDRNWLVCAGGGPATSDACAGDSGGPLLLESGGTQTLIGVVNSGELCTPTSLQNGIYTGVAAYRTWIDQIVGATTDPGGPDPGDPSDPDPGDPDDLEVPDDVVIGSGDVQVTLVWTGGADLDLHVIDPAGEEIYYANRESASGGQLDRDAIPSCGDTGTQVENIFWPDAQAPSGTYEAWVNVFRNCEPPSSFLLEVLVDGVVVDSISGTTTFDRSDSLFFTVGADSTGPDPADPDPTGPDPADPDPADDDNTAPTITFIDVPTGFVHEPGIEAVAEAGITTGCAANRYCPAAPVTRAQMATFLMRSLDLTDPGGTPFLDVPDSFVHAPGIRAVAAAGITTGCTPGRYCPADPVTRAQMATFLNRALNLPAGANAGFIDVPTGSVHAPGINAVAAAGITTGCAPGRYCPGDPVSRGQMATFLDRAVLQAGTPEPDPDDQGPDATPPTDPSGPADPEPFNVTAQGIEGAPPASHLVDWLTERLGTPSEDTGWFLEECAGEVDLRWVTWGSFTVALERRGTEVVYLAVRFSLDADPPAGPLLPEGFTPGMTWGQAQQLGAVLEPFYGYYEVPGAMLFGNVANRDWPPLDADPLADVIVGLPGAFYIAGC